MNEKELIGKIHSSMYHQLQVRGYATPVDVLIDTGILPKQKYEDWRFGRVRYLEAVCNSNLKRLSFVLHQMRVYAQAHELKPSFCYYKRWGVRKRSGTDHKPVIPLQFSKSGSPEIEWSYALIRRVCRNSKRRSRKQKNNHQRRRRRFLRRRFFAFWR